MSVEQWVFASNSVILESQKRNRDSQETMPIGEYLSVPALQQKRGTRMNAVDNLTERLRKEIARHGGVKHPIGLHAWPKNGKDGWKGVGPVNWSGGNAVAWFDVQCGDGGGYAAMNRQVASACEVLGVPFVSMA